MAIDLAGSTLAWRFLASTELRTLFGARPWEGDESLVIRARGDRACGAQRVLSAIEQSVRGFDPAGALRIASAMVDDDDVALLLERLHNIAPSVAGRRRLQAVDAALDRPTLWLIWTDGDGARLESELSILADAVRKIGAEDAVPLIAVVVHGGGDAGRFDLATGLPVDSPFEHQGARTDELWRRYVHWRLAWFSAGSPGRAEELAHGVWRQLRGQDDSALEAALNDAATTWWSDLPATVEAQASAWLAEWPSPRAHPSLTAAAVLWRPPSDPSRGVQLAPWAARARLLRDPQSKDRSFLRACEICQPLAVAGLTRCLQFEAIIKAWHQVRGPVAAPTDFPPDSDELRSQRAHERLQLVPSNNPSRASTVLDFGGLGFVLHNLVRDPLLRELTQELRRVRNALAHGHPPSWMMVRALAQLERRLPG